MQCSHPLLAYQVNPGEPLKFYNHSLTYIVDNFTKDKINHNIPIKSKLYLLRCGKCVNCRLAKSQETANRIFGEVSTSQSSYGVTLTYEDEYLPYGREVNNNIRPTLVPEHMTKFMKDLRRYFDYHYGVKKIRFYGVGEYGSIQARPHYHLILFNCNIPDLKLSNDRSQTGEPMYESEIISSIWNKGRVRINEVTWDYAAYCARYIMKKQLGEGKVVYDELGIEPEFVRQSNRPGIGYDYLVQNSDKIYNNNGFYVKKGLNVVKVPIPHYYQDKLVDFGFDMDKIKEDSKKLSEAQFRKLRSLHSQDIFQFLEDMEGANISKSKGLPRSLV